MDWLGIAGIIVGFAAIIVSVYAILDVRKHVRDFLEHEYSRASTHTRIDMAWMMYIDPVGDTYPPTVAKAITGLALLTHQVDPTADPKAILSAIHNDAFDFANELVTDGKAKWKQGLDPDAIRRELEEKWGRRQQ
jgi:hypothetical protein